MKALLMKDPTLVFNLTEWRGFPAGTPWQLAEPSAAHLQARALVKGSGMNDRYIKLAGSDVEATYVPRDEYLKVFGTTHPNCPSVTGPFIGQYGNVDFDRLPADTLAQVSRQIKYPFVVYTVCMNDLYAEDKDGQPVIIGGKKLPTTLKVKIPKSVKEVSAKTVHSELEKRINLTFKDFDIVEDPNW